MNTLEFIQSWTVAQFKNLVGADTLTVKQNGDKFFFTWGPDRSQIGAVSKSGVPTRPIISKVHGDATPENPSGEFYLLHNEGDGGCPTVATF